MSGSMKMLEGLDTHDRKRGKTNRKDSVLAGYNLSAELSCASL